MSKPSTELLSSAAWSLHLPSAPRVLCFTSGVSKLFQELGSRGARLDVMVAESRSPDFHGQDVHLITWQKARVTTYNLVILWEPCSREELQSWLEKMATLATPPKEVAIWCRNRWVSGRRFRKAPFWGQTDALLEARGWRIGSRVLGLPAAERLRQMVEWQAYTRTPLVHHRRSDKAWKRWVRQRGWYRLLQPLRFARGTREEELSRSLFCNVLQAASARMGCPLQVTNTLISPNGTAIVLVDCRDHRQYFKAVLKISYLAAAQFRLENNAHALRWAADTLPGRWSQRVPRLLGEGHVDGRFYCIEEHAEGQEAQSWNEPAVQAVLEYLWEFLKALASVRTSEQSASALVEKLYAGKLRAIKRLLQADSAQHLQRLWDTNLERMGRARIPLVARHGDFKLENVLGNPLHPHSSKILDWELWSERGLPLLDAIHLLLSRHRRIHGLSIGHAIRRWLVRGRWTSSEQGILRNLAVSLDPDYVRGTPFLYWLDRAGPIALRGEWPSAEWEKVNVSNVLLDFDLSAAEARV